MFGQKSRTSPFKKFFFFLTGEGEGWNLKLKKGKENLNVGPLGFEISTYATRPRASLVKDKFSNCEIT